MSDYKQYPIRFKAGMNPNPDSTEQDTVYIINGNNVRFADGKAEKIGGHIKAAYTIVDVQGNTLSITEISGVPRTIITFERSNVTWEVIGTNSHLYAKSGSVMYNITPLVTTATATLPTDPLELTSGSKVMTVNYTAHGLAVGDRFKFSGATHGTGGFAATNINVEHVVYSVTNANKFTVRIANNAPVTDATEGGAVVQIFKQIASGGASAVVASGAWVGIPFVGAPWLAGTDSSLYVQPRIWWADMFGDTLLCGDGNGGKCYYWNATTATAPTVITNAPTTVDWAWVEDAKLVTLYGNKVKNSNTGDYTNWTVAAGSNAYEDDKEDATKLISRAYVNGENLIFAKENKIFRLRWVGGAVKWLWQEVTGNIGAISPHAHCVIGGICYFMGRDAIYYYNGGLVQEVPNNTLKNYIFDNINATQAYKSFLWFNGKFNELWGHYPSAGATENDRCFIFNLSEGHWTKREDLDRSAADIKGQILTYPLLASSSTGLYQHEYGYNNDTAALNAWIQTSYKTMAHGKYITEIYGLEPDLIQTGSLQFELYGKTRASDDAPVLLATGTAGESDGTVDMLEDTRWWSWIIRSNTTDGFFRTGGIKEFLARGSEF